MTQRQMTFKEVCGYIMSESFITHQPRMSDAFLAEADTVDAI